MKTTRICANGRYLRWEHFGSVREQWAFIRVKDKMVTTIPWFCVSKISKVSFWKNCHTCIIFDSKMRGYGEVVTKWQRVGEKLYCFDKLSRVVLSFFGRVWNAPVVEDRNHSRCTGVELCSWEATSILHCFRIVRIPYGVENVSVIEATSFPSVCGWQTASFRIWCTDRTCISCSIFPVLWVCFNLS